MPRNTFRSTLAILNRTPLFAEPIQSILASIFEGNSASGTCGGAQFESSNASIVQSVMAFNAVVSNTSLSNLCNTNSLVQSSFSTFYTSPGVSGTNTALSSNDKVEDPQFLNDSRDGNLADNDYHLGLASPLINTGDPTQLDPDGSRADIGLFGGPNAALFDLDGDGYPLYFWPGTYLDVPLSSPVSIDSSDFDCDDADLDVYPGQGCP